MALPPRSGVVSTKRILPCCTHTRPIALAGFRSRIGHQRHAEGSAVKVGGLTRVADVELDVVGAFQREKIVAGSDRFGSRV